MNKLVFVFMLFIYGCRSDATHTTYLQDYAKRERIPDTLDEQGENWPQYIYDFSVSHGPNLNNNEMNEYKRWKK